MSKPSLAAVEHIAQLILADDPGPIVRHRLLRDVLRVASDDQRLRTARRDMRRSQWVVQLARLQQDDGSWGRFHTQATRSARQPFTTETAIERAIELGLDRTHPIMRRAATYVSQILRDERPFPERESNDRWPTGMRLFAASTLARIAPERNEIDPVWQTWAKVLEQTFHSGRYVAAREAR